MSESGFKSFTIKGLTMILSITLILNISLKNELVPTYPCSIVSKGSAFNTKLLTFTVISPFLDFDPATLYRLSKFVWFKYKTPLSACSYDGSFVGVSSNDYWSPDFPCMIILY